MLGFIPVNKIKRQENNIMAENNNIYGDTEAVYIIVLVYKVSMDGREVIYVPGYHFQHMIFLYPYPRCHRPHLAVQRPRITFQCQHGCLCFKFFQRLQYLHWHCRIHPNSYSSPRHVCPHWMTTSHPRYWYIFYVSIIFDYFMLLYYLFWMFYMH